MGYLDQVWSQNGWILAKFEVYKLAKKEQASGPYIAGGGGGAGGAVAPARKTNFFSNIVFD